MGGFGSGNWHRQRFHETVDSLPELFVIDFKKSSGEVEAKPRDEINRREIKFRYIRNGQAVLLFPSEVSENRDSETLAPILQIVSTPCHFGGHRYWLLCPEANCGGRVKSLFIDEYQTIACRKCLGLLYESQYGGKIENQLSRLRAVHRKMLRGGIKQIAVVHQTQQQFQSLIDDIKKLSV